MAQKKGALEGIKIANFSWVGVGPLTIRYLAASGATVVRVESHTRPDVLRLMMPYKDKQPGVDRGPWFAEVNNSVRSVSIDLGKPTGRAIAWKLIMWADVMAESFVPGTMKKWGLDYDNVRQKKPDIIYLSTCQMGQSGPYANFSGFGYQAAAIGGFTYVSGWPDRTPAPTQGAYTDFIAPRFGATAIMAALDYRRRTGKGQYLDQSQFETSAHFLAAPIMDYEVNNRVLERSGNHVDYAAPHAAYPCKGDDRWVAISIFTDAEWQDFCLTLDKPEWLDDPRFATLLARKENEDELDRQIAGWTVDRTAEEVEVMMQDAGIAASVVNSVKDIIEDPHLKSQNFLRTYNHSVVGPHLYRALCHRLSKTPDTMGPGPALGEHNEYVFKELLHLTDDEVADGLVEGGITTEANLPEFKPTL
ncbi:MAG: CoA transferase [Dehalococcoidia bacterium]|nr:CoA transferase [Dehalococcoidia bacterium]